MSRRKNCLTLFLALTCLASAASAEMIDISTDGARAFLAQPGKSLASAGASPEATLKQFLRSRGVPGSAVESLILTNVNPGKAGRTHVRYEQEANGLRVYGTYVKATFTSSGELVGAIENLATPPSKRIGRTKLSPNDAISIAVAQHHPNYDDQKGYFYSEPSARKVAVALKNGGLHEGYLVETWSQADNLLHHTIVGRNGRILHSELRTNTDSYNIFPDHPGNSSQTVTAGPGAGNTESPVGWLFAGNQGSQDIAGNNVNAYLDVDDNNASDGTGSVISDGNFLTSADLGQDPSINQNKDVAVQNLFYFNNWIHDKLYRHGFTEAAGNFQEDNFGNGGSGSDSVNAEAQDGSGTNNANFSTPSDGSNPRMQMYIWTQSTPRRDGDLDSDIIYHEYGHGLTWRMIGSMSGPMSGAVGEGMSDVLSILINNDDVVGEYSYNDPIGIRSEPYTNYSRTYGDFGGSSVHFDGEIYAATIWDLWLSLDADGVSQDTLFDYLVDGMNFTAAGPAMEDMRDGILASAAGSGHECTIWEAFAAHGIGDGASATVKGGGPFGGGNVTVNESFELPAECGGGGPGGCELGQVGDPCSANADCCSNKCKGPSGRQTCK